MPNLFIYPKKGDSLLFALKKEKISIGRSAANDIFLADPFCSSHHCLVYPSDAGYMVKDNGSKNGTFLNGKRVLSEMELKKGDEILIGSTRIIFDQELAQAGGEVTDYAVPPVEGTTDMHLDEVARKETETRLAAQIKKDILPKENPNCENFEIQGSIIPCHDVGGNYFDFIEIDPARLGIFVADASEKGVSVSLLLASLRASLRSEIYPQYGLAAAVTKLIDFIHINFPSSTFVTFFLGELDTRSGELNYINAGHPPPVMLSAEGEIYRLDGGNSWLGAFPSGAYKTKKVVVNAGDLVFLFTDGIPKARDTKSNELGEKKLIELFRAHSQLSAGDLLRRINEEIDLFTSGADQLDDRTLIIIKRKTGILSS